MSNFAKNIAYESTEVLMVKIRNLAVSGDIDSLDKIEQINLEIMSRDMD